MRGAGVRLVGRVIAIDLVQIDQVRVLSVAGNVEHQAAGLGGHGSGGVDLDGIDEGLGTAGPEAGLDKDAVHGNFLLF